MSTKLGEAQYNTRKQTKDFIVVADDMEDLNILRKDLPKLDGILGHRTLDDNNAIIDYSTDTLYLISHLRKLWPRLKGDWQCVKADYNGSPFPDNLVEGFKVRFVDDELEMTLIDSTMRYGIHIKHSDDGKQFVLFDKEEELTEKGPTYYACGVYGFKNDQFIMSRICSWENHLSSQRSWSPRRATIISC